VARVRKGGGAVFAMHPEIVQRQARERVKERIRFAERRRRVRSLQARQPSGRGFVRLAAAVRRSTGQRWRGHELGAGLGARKSLSRIGA